MTVCIAQRSGMTGKFRCSPGSTVVQIGRLREVEGFLTSALVAAWLVQPYFYFIAEMTPACRAFAVAPAVLLASTDEVLE
jgi:hypothetical protein